MKETYEELTLRMTKAATRPIETRPSWRDYLHFLRPTKVKVCSGVFLLGATLSIVSGHIFLEKLTETVQRADESNDLPYKNLDKALANVTKPREVEYDPVMDYSSIGVIGGLGAMAGAAIFGTIKPHERWSYKSQRGRQHL